MRTIKIKIKRPHKKQEEFINSKAKRKVIRAGRRGGKTTGAAILAAQAFLSGKRVLYATPTQDQVDKFWTEVRNIFYPLSDQGIFYKNETRHIIEKSRSEESARIRAKTAWDAETLRGDYADLLIMDEYQLMKENAWNEVGAPMLADNDGDAIFIFTEKRGKNHAKDLFKKAANDDTGRYKIFSFSSFENPHISKKALDDLTQDMSELAYRGEILAEEITDDPRALWHRELIVYKKPEALKRIVVAVDPSGSSSGNECGIIVAGVDYNDYVYVLEDGSLQGSPREWGGTVSYFYHEFQADRVVAEKNFGGEMVEQNIRVFDKSISYKGVTATRGKTVRAEPIVAQYEKGRVYHAKNFVNLEDEMCNWIQGEGESPNRVDALVWALTDLMITKQEFILT